MLLGSNGPLTNAPVLQARLAYDPARDFAPVAMLSRSPLTLTVGDIYYRSALSNPGGPITAGTRLYGQVDSFNSATSYGAVLEVHERDSGAYNNILGPVVIP